MIDSELLIAKVESELRTELGFPITTDEYLRLYVGLSTRSPEYQAGLMGLPADYRETTKRRVVAAMKTELQAISGAKEIVESLHLPKAIASSSTPEELEFSLGIVGLYEHFRGRVFSATMVEHPKPAPDLYFYTAEKTGHRPEGCLVIEDSVVGATAAVQAGMTVLGFTGAGHSTADSREKLLSAGAVEVFNEMRDFPAILSRFGKKTG